MTARRSAPELLEAQFNEMRHRVLGLAADLDRLSLAGETASAQDDPRMKQLREAIALLGEAGDDRAARVQLIFSDAYDPGWKSG